MKVNNLDYLKLVQDINALVEGDALEDIDLKLYSKRGFTQAESRDMARLLGEVYRLSHYWYCGCGDCKKYLKEGEK